MAVSEEIDIQEAVSENLQAVAPLGEVFLSARQAKNLTLQDVSNSLRYSIKQINALESNDFSALPEPMIMRGFIRNYARLLGLDAEPLLASYRGRMPDIVHGEISVKSSVGEVSLTKESLPWLKYILGSIMVLLFLLAWFFYMEHQQKNTTLPVEHAPVAPEVAIEAVPLADASLPEMALPAAERETVAGLADETANAVNPEAPVNAPASATLNVVAAQPASADFPPVSANQATVSPSANTGADLAKKSVSISVTDKTWVSVTDKSGKVVFEKMLSAGSAESFDGVPPLNLVTGNAIATTLVYSGKPVDLTGQAKLNVARIRLE